jgi:hypothetical protein
MVEFRTFYDDGLLVYVTNEEKTDFVAVQLLGGRLETLYKDNTLVSGRNLGDGRWHQVTIATVCHTFYRYICISF